MENWKQKFMLLPGRQEEIDWIRQRLEVMSVKEELAMSAAAWAENPRRAAEAIQIMLSIPYYEVCAGASSYETLGEFYLQYNSDESIPPEVCAFIDKEELGVRYEDLHPGLFVGNHYVEYPPTGTELPQYDGIHLPAEDHSWSLRLKLASRANPKGVWICLPDYENINENRPGEIEIAFQELEVEHNSECTLLDARCVLPGITGLMKYDSLTDLIYDGQNLGIILDERGQGQRHFVERFLAALELENCTDLKSALEIGGNLNCYDFVLAEDLKQYGRNAVRWNNDSTEKLIDGCLDYEGYAKHLLEQKGFQSVLDDRAYIARNCQTFVGEYAQSPPEMTM